MFQQARSAAEVHRSQDNSPGSTDEQSDISETAPSNVATHATSHLKTRNQMQGTSSITNQRLQNMRGALKTLRESFSDQATVLVDKVRSHVELRRSGRPEGLEDFYQELETQYNKLNSLHDSYGALETDYQTLEDTISLDRSQDGSSGDPPDRAISPLAASFKHLFPITEFDHESNSETSVMDPAMLEVYLLTSYVDKLAVADYYSELLNDSQTIKQSLLEGVTGTKLAGSEMHPYSDDLVSEYERQSTNRHRWRENAMQEARTWYEELRQNGLIPQDTDFDLPIHLHPSRAPPRSALLFPLDYLMHEEPYDQPIDMISADADYTPRTIAHRVNTWLLHMLQRSAMQVLLFRTALLAENAIKPGWEHTSLLEHWTEDEITKRLWDMPLSTAYDRGSTSTSKRTQASARNITISKDTTRSSDGTRIDDTYLAGQQFFPEQGGVPNVYEAPIDPEELAELFGDIDDAEIPIVPLK